MHAGEGQNPPIHKPDIGVTGHRGGWTLARPLSELLLLRRLAGVTLPDIADAFPAGSPSGSPAAGERCS